MKIDMAAKLVSLILLLALAHMTKGVHSNNLQHHEMCRRPSELRTSRCSCQLVVQVYIEMEPTSASKDLSR